MPDVDVSANRCERPNIFSVGWSHGVEVVPSYESSPNDPHAVAYRIGRGTTPDSYELHCNALHEDFGIEPFEDSKLKKSAERPLQVVRYGSEETPPQRVATISSIIRKKLNIKQKEPTIKLNSSHGEIALSLYRGGYCGYAHPTQKIEYFWQLRYYERRSGEKGSNAAKFKDAVLRRTAEGELSSMSDLSGAMPADDETEKDLGRLLLRSDLDEFDKESALLSLIALLLRVIEAEKKVKFASGLINAFTIGET